jgi:hypothetical protein
LGVEWSIPNFINFNKKIKMEFKKKVLREAVNVESNNVKTFSEKPQNVIVTESQLERLIENLNN